MNGKSQSDWATLVGILTVAALFRIAYCIFLPGTGRDLLHSDMGLYDKAAWQMAQQAPVVGEPGFNGYHPMSASTYVYAGYVYFLALIYAVFGHHPEAVRMIQSVIATATVWLVYVIGARVFGRRAGQIAALLCALYLPLVYYAGLLLSETWFLFLELAVLAVWLSAWGAKSSVDPSAADLLGASSVAAGGNDTAVAPPKTSLPLAWIAGLLAGCACITRTAFLPAVASLGVFAWLLPPVPVRLRRRAALVGSFVLGSVLVIAPITIRNYQIHKQFVLVSTNGPSTFFVGHVLHTAFVPQEFTMPNDMEMATAHRQVNWAYIRSLWMTYLAEVPDFFGEMWFSNEFWPQTTIHWRYEPVIEREHSSRVRSTIDEPGGPPIGRIDFFPDLMRYVDRLLWLLIGFPLGLWAVFFLPPGSRRWVVVYAALVPFAIIPFLAPGFARYRIPAVPLFFILAGQTIWVCLRSRRALGSRV
jgi:4-amino-4-deoxy-L-arabinose transferase-like glycosyltransferase